MRILLVGLALLLTGCSDSDDKKSTPCAMPLGGFCVCGANAPPTGSVRECSAATMGGDVVCCQGKDDCSCGTFDCSKNSSDSCFCTSVGVGDNVSQCTGTICCASPGGTCSCGTSACSGDEKQVTSCSAVTARCSAGTTRVTKCGG